MFEHYVIDHHIQKHILGVLIHQKVARFRDLRPLRTDTNLFSYHLKVLIKEEFIDKGDGGYTLSKRGLTYVDRVSLAKLNIRSQPKIITMLLVQNSDGKVLLQKRTKQPYIDTWTLPYGKLHIDDRSIEAAAIREAKEKLNVKFESARHSGDCYIRVYSKGVIISATLAHIFWITNDDVVLTDDRLWVSPHKLTNHTLSPAVEAIVTRSFFGDAYFFMEHDEDWYN